MKRRDFLKLVAVSPLAGLAPDDVIKKPMNPQKLTVKNLKGFFEAQAFNVSETIAVPVGVYDDDGYGWYQVVGFYDARTA